MRRQTISNIGERAWRQQPMCTRTAVSSPGKRRVTRASVSRPPRCWLLFEGARLTAAAAPAAGAGLWAADAGL